MSAVKSIAILGAGLTGLAAAHRLTKQGHRVRLFEQSARIGGPVGTELIDGWLIEHGTNTLLENEPALTTLITELGLGSERVVANPAAKNRFIVRNGQPIALPLSPPALLKTQLFSTGAKLRLLRELFARPRTRETDVSLADFVRAHFGDEFVDYALNPFVSGIYAGDPDKLSARHAFPRLWSLEETHGSLLRGQAALGKARKARGETAPSLISFKRGLQTLPDALAARLPPGTLQSGARVEQLTLAATWQVRWTDGQSAHTENFDAVISALNAGGLSQLAIGPGGERPLAALGEIEHPALSSLFLGFRREDVAHPLNGFGLLVPSVENRSVLGVLFSSTLFPGRAPEGHVALTVMVGGMRQQALAQLPADQLLACIRPDLERFLGVKGAPVFSRHVFYPRAIPQYNLGYGRYLSAFVQAEQAWPGLYFGGQARDGIAAPACLAAGEKLAARAIA